MPRKSLLIKGQNIFFLSQDFFYCNKNIFLNARKKSWIKKKYLGARERARKKTTVLSLYQEEFSWHQIKKVSALLCTYTKFCLVFINSISHEILCLV